MISIYNKKVNILGFFAVLILSLCFTQAHAQTGTLKVSPVSINYNTEGEVTVVYDNTTAASAFQFAVNLPTGFTYVANSAVLQTDRKADHQLSANVQSGKLTLIGYSISGADMKGTSGALVKFKVKAPAQPGNHTLQLSEVEFSNKTGAKVDVNAQPGTVTVLAPQLSTSNEMHFGSVPLGEERQNHVYIYNTGTQDLKISDITTDDERFKINVTLPITITAGSWGTYVPVTFKSTVKGEIAKKLTITSNSSTDPVKVVALKATAFAVNEMRVGNVTSKNLEEATVSVSINNMEAFSAFEFRIPLAAEMEYVAGSAVLSARQDGHSVSASVKDKMLTLIAFSLNNKPFKLKEGEVVSFKLKTTGQGSFPLTLQSAEISDLNGVNVISAAYGGSLTIQSPSINLSSTALDFGKIAITGSGEKELILYNYGQADLVITGMDLASTYFKHNLTFPITITPGNNKRVLFSFSGAPAGTYNITAKLYHSDKNNNPTSIQLNAVAFEPNELQVADLIVVKGGIGEVTVNLINYSNITGFQFDITLPDGITASKEKFALTTRANGHAISVGEIIKNKQYRVLVYSMASALFSGKEGAVVKFPVNVASNVPTGTYNIAISNAEISDDKLKDVLSTSKNGKLTVASPKISLSASTLDLGDVSVIGSKTKSLTVTNTGQADLVISGIELNSAHFTHNLTFPLTVAAGASKEVSFTFASSVAGEQQVIAKLHHNDTGNTPSEVTLKAKAVAYPNISLSTSSLDFGDVSVVGSKQEKVVISNPGQGDLVISSVDTGSEYFTHNLTLPLTIAAGASKEVAFTFSNAPAGNYQVTARINHNAGGSTPSEVQLRARAVAYPSVSLSASALDFGQVQVGTTKERELTISNTGQGELVLSSLDLGGTEFTHNLAFPLTIAAGSSRGAIITFSPTDAGTKEAAADLTHNDTDRSPSRFTLKGSGFHVPAISLSSSSLDFGDMPAGSTKEKSLTISNTGQADLVISGIEIGNAYFTHNLTLPFTIAAGASKEAIITFADAPAGEYQVTAKIHHNDASKTPALITLKASVHEPYANVLSIGDLTVTRGGTAQAEVKLTNNSNIIGFQFDVTLPQGVTASAAEFVLSSRANGHSITVSEVAANKLRVIVFSMSASKFLGAEGAVVTFPVKLGASVSNGTYAIILSNAEASNDKLKQVLSGTSNGKLTVISPVPAESVLSSPANNSINIPLQPQLTWQATSDADSYKLQVSTAADFSTTLFNLSDLSSTNYNIAQDLVINTTYYWRVQALNSTGAGAWSDTWSFTTQSTITSIKDDLDESFIVYPNPSTGALKLTLPVKFSAGMVQVKELNGRLVFERRISRVEDTLVIDASGLASGTYIVVLLEDKKIIGIRRWIKI